MPTYLCHGFRWARKLIRVFVVLEDLEDVAPDWVTGRASSAAILERLSTRLDYLPQRPSRQQTEQKLEQLQEQTKQEEKKIAHQDDDLTAPPSRVPDSEDSVLVNQSSPVKLLEEYDQEETSMSARPYAYVADHVIRIDLSANVLKEIAKYEALVKERNEGNWLERLRDDLTEGAPIEWYVVVNGDEERSVPQYDDDVEDEESNESEVREMEEVKLGEEESEPKHEQQAAGPSQPRSTSSGNAASRSVSQQHSLRHKISRAGLRRLFSKKEAPE